MSFVELPFDEAGARPPFGAEVSSPPFALPFWPFPFPFPLLPLLLLDTVRLLGGRDVVDDCPCDVVGDREWSSGIVADVGGRGDFFGPAPDEVDLSPPLAF